MNNHQLMSTSQGNDAHTAAKQAVWNVSEYGAAGIARPGEPLELTNLSYKWISYQPGTQVTVYYPVAGCCYDSIGIQRAIDAAHAAGGGTVVVPSGDYLIAPIKLRSRVSLHLEAGARLWGSPYLKDYVNSEGLGEGAPTFEDSERLAATGKSVSTYPYRPVRPGGPLHLIYAEDAEDIAVTGRGAIHSQSPAWVIPWMNEGPTGWQSLDFRRPSGQFLFFRCQRVLVEGIRIMDSPSWTLVFSKCSHVRVHGVTIRNFDVINADGIDLVDTDHVVISDCDIHCTDDGICLKTDISSSTLLGVRNVTVSNCIIRTWCNGVKIGTESNGVFENILFSNIVVQNPEDDLKGAESGINIAICDGGTARNICFRGIVMRNVECPFFLVTTPRKRFRNAPGEPRPGRIEWITLSGIQANGTRLTPFIVGCPGQPVRNVSLSDISIRRTHGFQKESVSEAVPACAQQYPTPFMFGSLDGGRRDCGDGLPAYGVYFRDAQGMAVRGLRVVCEEPDRRLLVAWENCADVDLLDGGSDQQRL